MPLDVGRNSQGGHRQDDLELVGTVDKNGAGEDIGQVCGLGELGFKTVADLVVPSNTAAEVMVDFTAPLGDG